MKSPLLSVWTISFIFCLTSCGMGSKNRVPQPAETRSSTKETPNSENSTADSGDEKETVSTDPKEFKLPLTFRAPACPSNLQKLTSQNNGTLVMTVCQLHLSASQTQSTGDSQRSYQLNLASSCPIESHTQKNFNSSTTNSSCLIKFTNEGKIIPPANGLANMGSINGLGNSPMMPNGAMTVEQFQQQQKYRNEILMYQELQKALRGFVIESNRYNRMNQDRRRT